MGVVEVRGRNGWWWSKGTVSVDQSECVLPGSVERMVECGTDLMGTG